MNLHTWAARWNIPLECLRDLQTTLGTYTPPLPAEAPGAGKSEAWVQSVVRLEASEKGVKLFRNNVGVLEDKTGRPVRYGLGNDSPKMNEVIKSGDLIGLKSIIVTPAMVGHCFGQFVSIECKSPGWQFTGTGREKAQLAWANLVNSMGGMACFATGPGTL